MKLVREGINESFSKVENKLNSLGVGLVKVIRDWMSASDFEDGEYIITPDNIVHIYDFVSMRRMEELFKNRPLYIKPEFLYPVSRIMLDLVDDNFEDFEYMVSITDFKKITCNTTLIAYINEFDLKKYALILLNNKSFSKQASQFPGYKRMEKKCKNNEVFNENSKRTSF